MASRDESEDADDASSIQDSSEELSLLQILKKLMRNREFVFILITITIIYYVVAGIQYWTTSYMITVLRFQKNVASSFVAISSITAPITGLIIGGIISSYQGGYQT